MGRIIELSFHVGPKTPKLVFRLHRSRQDPFGMKELLLPLSVTCRLFQLCFVCSVNLVPVSWVFYPKDFCSRSIFVVDIDFFWHKLLVAD